MKHRLFVAIDLSPWTKKQLTKISDSLSKSVKGIKWERENNLHLTLKFLGNSEISNKIVSETVQKKLAGQVSGFVVQFGQINTFVDTNTIIVIDVLPSEELLRLYHMINNCLEPIGFKRDKKPFHPHITLGRSKSAFFPEIGKISAYIEPSLVESVYVFESKQGNLGLNYKIVNVIRLA